MGTYQQIPSESGRSSSSLKAFSKTAGLGAWLPFVLFYAVFVNIPFWAASHWLGILQKGCFCLEYLAVGLLALFLPRAVASLLLIIAIAVDMVTAVSQTYYLSVYECLVNVGAIRHFPGFRLLPIFAVAVFILLAAAVAAMFPVATIQRKYRAHVAVCLVGFCLIALVFDGPGVLRRNGYVAKMLHQKRRRIDGITQGDVNEFRFSRVPSVRLIEDEYAAAKVRKRMGVGAATASPMASAAVQALGSANISAGVNSRDLPNIIVIVVESWGVDLEPAVSGAVTAAYAQPDLAKRYQVLRGTVPFNGPTIAGEARELCGSMMGFHLLDASAKELEGCLPARLDALGYRSTAIHGMEGHFFERSTWYKTIGFQETWFREQLDREGLPDCPGVFPGSCDAAIAHWMGHRLEQRKASPEFLYWMTLNSHLPVLVPAPLKTGASCTATPSLTRLPTLCSWFQLVANVHQSVAELAMSKLGRPTVFAIVGDHAPPFSETALRRRFSAAEVPYVLLVPRREYVSDK